MQFKSFTQKARNFFKYFPRILSNAPQYKFSTNKRKTNIIVLQVNSILESFPEKWHKQKSYIN